ncbi:MAG: polysaccharide deacetylase family protein [Pirellulaceae bacterium]|nr:polysaccharide deacetylase family protein [Pirellulaceae bacterium]
MHVVLTYDVEELDNCVPKLQTIWKIHRQFDAPLTLFVVGQLIEQETEPLIALLADGGDMFDVNSHTYSHSRLFVKPPWSLPVPTTAFIHEEITRGVQVVRERLDRPCRGR